MNFKIIVMKGIYIYIYIYKINTLNEFDLDYWLSNNTFYIYINNIIIIIIDVKN